jgi:nicotinate-nucleotide pyrophosphorylase (carboxylating)
MLWESFDMLLSLARLEDLSLRGDATSEAIFSDEQMSAVLIAKDNGVLSGADFFREVFNRIDSSIAVELKKVDGDKLLEGDVVAEVRGPARTVLSAERIAVNFLSYLSGIATKSAAFSQEAARYGKNVILDTRKTLPGYRALAKYAVRTGGAQNHRQGLYDMVMIKDNHIDAAGSIAKAVQKVREKWADSLDIEVECRTAEEVKEAARQNVTMIMLDNMSPDQIQKILAETKRTAKFEISGNMTMAKLKDYAGLGADYISVGTLTHSVEVFDFSLIVPEGR